MEKRLIVLLFVCVHGTGTLYAQWSKEDSVWLDKVLSGKEQLRLNPETMKAIKEGTLINPEGASPGKLMKPAPSALPLSKDFSEYLVPLETEGKIDLLDVSPAVFMRYGLDIPLLREAYDQAAFATPQSVKDNARRPSGISFDDMLRSVFQPGFRAKSKNRKNANAWKSY